MASLMRPFRDSLVESFGFVDFGLKQPFEPVLNDSGKFLQLAPVFESLFLCR